MIQVLDKLFGGSARVKLMRFFLQNPYAVYTLVDVGRVLKLRRHAVKKEVGFLLKTGLIKKGVKEVDYLRSAEGGSASGRKGRKEPRRKKEYGFEFSQSFPYGRELKALIVEACPVPRDLILKRFKRLGNKIRLVLLSGVFAGSRATGIPDIFVIADTERRNKLEKLIGGLESEMGQELSYTVMNTEEFKYRQGMYDKFVWDILESEHDKLIDTLGA